MIQWILVWFLVLLPFLYPAWTYGSSWFMYCWILAWRILSVTFLACEMSAIVQYFQCCLALPFFGIGMKTDIFQSCGHCWVFQICWHIECSTFSMASFRIWNSSTGIPSPPLALFIVMFPKAHLTSHSRMSGSRCVITPLWLSGSWRSFLYSSSVYYYHLLILPCFILYSKAKFACDSRYLLISYFCIPRCMALGEWSHYCGYLGHEDLFCIVLLCILSTSSQYLLLLLGSYHFCPLLCPSFLKMFPWYL